VTARNAHRRLAAFTFVELLVGMGVCGMFAAGLLVVWSSLSFAALNTTSFSSLQNDHMRVLDYMKRDIRRATKVELLEGATLVTSTGIFVSQLRLTIPDYYADTAEEDASFASKTGNTPVVTNSAVTYGTPFTVRYYTLAGAGIRRESGISRTLADAAGGFAFSFLRETSGAIRCRVAFDQTLRGSSNRKLRRTVETLCVPRSELQL
jgi:type II secretory pathway pseudopilin PulG